VANLVIRNDRERFGIVASPSPVSRGQWHHMVSIFDAGTLTIYVDGVQVRARPLAECCKTWAPRRTG